MLTRIIGLSWLLWAVVFPVIALAQNSSGKVVVIHYEAVIRECSEGKRAFAEFVASVASLAATQPTSQSAAAAETSIGRTNPIISNPLSSQSLCGRWVIFAMLWLS